MEKKRIGILTGGGDCAGLNPAIKWVVKTALDDRLQRSRKIQYEVIGIRDGWKGLIHPDADEDAPASRIVVLTEEMVRTWTDEGRTWNSRTNHRSKNNRSAIVPTTSSGSNRFPGCHWRRIPQAHKLSRESVNVVGIPNH
jgi:6-phosphofructokinase 1